MKTVKKLLCLLFVSFSLASYSQNFLLIDPSGNPYSDGDEITLSISENDLVLDKYCVEIDIQNQTARGLRMNTLRTNTDLVEGMFSYACFGVCDETGEEYFMFWEVESSETYFLYLIPNGKIGLSKFKLEFWSDAEQADKITLFVNIDMQPLTIKGQSNEKVSLSAYPNPVQAGSTIHVTYSLPEPSNTHNFVIKNILGAEVMRIPLNPNEKNITVNTTSLVQGVYFYAIENKNRVSIVKKLIVK